MRERKKKSLLLSSLKTAIGSMRPSKAVRGFLILELENGNKFKGGDKMLEQIKEVAEVTKGLQLERLHFLMWWCFMDRKMLIVSFLKKN